MRLLFFGGIADFFESIVDFFTSLFDIIGAVVSLGLNLITGLLDLLFLIPKGVSFLTNSLGALPSFLLAFASVTITVSVIFIIVNRNPGGKK